jgi:multiple sugar transport system substrate-binding protein
MERFRFFILFFVFFLISVPIALFYGGSCSLANADEVTIRLQDYFLEEEASLAVASEIVAEFESKFPNIKVKLESIPSCVDAIENLKGKSPPDISRVEAYFVPSLADGKLIKRLDEYVKEAGAIEYYWRPQFAEHTVVPCVYKKKMYAVPQEGSAVLLYINDELFKKAGINVEENPPRTWDQFLVCAKKLTDPKSGQWGFGGDFTSLTNAPINLQAWLRANNSDLFDVKGKKPLLDDKPGIQAFTFLVELHSVHHVMPPQIGQWNSEDMAKLFAEGKLGIMQGDFAASKIVYKHNPEMINKVKVLFFPGEVKFVGRSSAFCISRKSKHSDEAWECLQYLTIRPSLLKLFEKGRRFPARRWLYRGTVVEKDKDGMVFGKASAYASTPPLPPEWPDIAAVLVNALKEAFSGKQPPENAISDARKRIKKLM